MTIYDLIKKHPSWNLPSHCPECGTTLCVDNDATHITCENAKCKTHLLGRLQKWTNTFEVKEFGDAILSKLIDLGISSIADLYNKKFYDILAQQDGFGEKSAYKAFNNISQIKSMPLNKFVAGLNIRGIGEKDAEKIINFTKVNSIESLMQLTTEQCICEGIGKKKAESFVSGLNAIQSEVLQLQNIVDIETSKSESISNNTGKLAGLSFCFTGKMSKPRKEFEQAVTDNGGTVMAVSSGLKYLVQADLSSTSSKTQKAEKLGVNIISEEDFNNLLK